MGPIVSSIGLLIDDDPKLFTQLVVSSITSGTQTTLLGDDLEERLLRDSLLRRQDLDHEALITVSRSHILGCTL